MFRSSIAVTLAVLLGDLPAGLALPPSVAQAAPSTSTSSHDRSVLLRSRGLDLLFNLDYDDALARFQDAIALDPGDPAAHRFAASAIWMKILFNWGAILVDDYLGEAQDRVERPPPPLDADRAFHDHITRSIELAEARLRTSPRDPDAHYQVGSGFGFLASYVATVEGRVLGSLGSARRAYHEHERVLELDPQRKDAGLVVGMYRYSIALLSMPTRLLAYLAGFGADRARGLQLVEGAAAYGSDSQTDALFILIVLYSRENRYDDALRAIRELQRRYPRNRLLWLEAGTTALRAGRADDARVALEQGLAMLSADTRPRALGEVARWRWSYGSVLLALKRRDQADGELRLALAAAGPDWIHGRARRELGKLADLAGDRPRAIGEYRAAAALCHAGRDEPCADEAKRLIQTAYR